MRRTGSSELAFLGVSELEFGSGFAPEGLFFSTVARLFYAPEQVTAQEVDALAPSTGWPKPMRGILFTRSFTVSLTRALIRAAAEGQFDVKRQTPTFPFFGYINFDEMFSGPCVELGSAELEQIALELRARWDHLSTDARYFFLIVFQRVDHRTLNLVGGLMAQHLDATLRNKTASQASVDIASYAARLTEQLGLDPVLRASLANGVFDAVDLHGGLAAHPEFGSLIADYSKNHPGWVDMLVLSTEEGGEAKPGAVQLNWHQYNTPWLLAFSLAHEGGHSIQLRDQSLQRDLESLPVYWHRESSSAQPHDLISDYAGKNYLEFWAEHIRAWHTETAQWLERALDNFKAGDSAWLNMFLYIWGLPGPGDAPASSTRPLFLLRLDGVTERAFTRAEWKTGSMQDGIFEFEFNGRVYRTAYSGGFIRQLWEGDQLLREVPSAPVLALQPSPIIAPESAPLVFTNAAVVPSGGDAGALRWSLLSGPQGLQLDSMSGVLTWTPAAAQWGTNRVFVSVTDPSLPAAEAVSSLSIVVPGWPPPPIFHLAEQYSLEPATTLIISNCFEWPEVAMRDINVELSGDASSILSSYGLSQNGLTLQPCPQIAGQDYELTLTICDREHADSRFSHSFRVHVLRVNHAPAFNVASVYSLDQGLELTLSETALDVDHPANKLRFELIGESHGASLDHDTGAFRWRPAAEQAPGDYSFTLRVEDDGDPPADATASFCVELRTAAPVQLSARLEAGQEMRITVDAAPGRRCLLERSNDLIHWQVVTSLATADREIMEVALPVEEFSYAFFRIRAQ